jgi:hypothetical protein
MGEKTMRSMSEVPLRVKQNRARAPTKPRESSISEPFGRITQPVEVNQAKWASSGKLRRPSRSASVRPRHLFDQYFDRDYFFKLPFRERDAQSSARCSTSHHVRFRTLPRTNRTLPTANTHIHSHSLAISTDILVWIQQIAVEPTVGRPKVSDDLAPFVDAVGLVPIGFSRHIREARRIEIRELSLSEDVAMDHVVGASPPSDYRPLVVYADCVDQAGTTEFGVGSKFTTIDSYARTRALFRAQISGSDATTAERASA